MQSPQMPNNAQIDKFLKDMQDDLKEYNQSKQRRQELIS